MKRLLTIAFIFALSDVIVSQNTYITSSYFEAVYSLIYVSL